jgi:hypothetical protein
MSSRDLVVHLRAKALDPFTWAGYVPGSTWTHPIDLRTWSQTLLREVGDPLHAVTSDPVDIALGMLLVAHEELRALPERGKPIPEETATLAGVILRAAMVACEARPRWAKAIVTDRRTMADLFGILAHRIAASPYLRDNGKAWSEGSYWQAYECYKPEVYDLATLSIFESEIFAGTSWNADFRSKVIYQNTVISICLRYSKYGRETKNIHLWSYGDRFRFPIEETLDRVNNLPEWVGRRVLAQCREHGLTEKDIVYRGRSVPTSVDELRRAVAARGGYTERDRRRARVRVRDAFHALATTWSRHTEAADVTRFRVIRWPKARLEFADSRMTREGIVADPVQALANIRSVRDAVARRVQAAREAASEVSEAYREWSAAYDEWLVASGQVVPRATES